jgi:tetratricopeptide (TPR) repeat protein
MDVGDKAHAQRLSRLRTWLATRVDNPHAALEVLISELEAGASQADLWAALHAAATRDRAEETLASAYAKMASSQRVARLPADAAAAFFMHAADYAQSVRLGSASEEAFLERVLRLLPSHPDAFARFERRLDSDSDPRRALALYANAAAAPPIAPATLAMKAMHKVVMLKEDAPLADDACRKLVMLAADNPRLLRALDAHCRLTKRFALACEVIERALENAMLPYDDALALRRRLLLLYTGEAALPHRAIEHVEELLRAEPTDADARRVAERLLGVREVASRAASALAVARRNSQPPRR